MNESLPDSPFGTDAPKDGAARLRAWLSFLLKFGISAALIGFLLVKVDVEAVAHQLAGIAPWAIAVAFVLALTQAVICTERWRAVLNAIDAPLGFVVAFVIFVIGAFFSQVLPSSVGGDAVRMYKAYRAGLTVAAAVHGIVLERVATICGLAIVVAVGLPWFVSRVEPDVAAWMEPLVVLFGIGAIVGPVVLVLLERLPTSLKRWRLVGWAARLGTDARLLFARPRHAAWALAWSIAGHVNLSVVVYVLSIGLGIDVDLIDCIVLVPLILLITVLPVSIAGWGVREVSMVTAFGFVGVSEESALALSVGFGLLGALAALPGGLLWLRSDRSTKSPRRA